jgi:hypothetical protein
MIKRNAADVLLFRLESVLIQAVFSFSVTKKASACDYRLTSCAPVSGCW